MKKSEALKTLGLTEGATAEDIKKAHRKLAIENHPDRFGQDAEARAQAEERMKLINEARDVLESGKWEPENASYGSPFVYDPFSTGQATRPGSTGSAQNPFDDFPFGNGSFVWTTYSSDGTTRTYTSNVGGSGRPHGQTSKGSNEQNPFQDFPFGGPFNAESPFTGTPFEGSPFESFFTTKTPEAQLATETSELKQELAFIASKILLALLTAFLVSPALGLYLYVIGSLGWGLYKNLGFLTSFLVVPFVLLALVFAPGPKSVTGVFGLLAFIAALCWDCNDVYKHVQSIRSLKRQIGA